MMDKSCRSPLGRNFLEKLYIKPTFLILVKSFRPLEFLYIDAKQLITFFSITLFKQILKILCT